MTFFEWLMMTLFPIWWLNDKTEKENRVLHSIAEADLDFEMSRANAATRRKEDLAKALEQLEAEPLPEAKDFMTAEELAVPKNIYEFNKKAKEDRQRDANTLKNRLQVAEQEAVEADGAVNKLNAKITRARHRWDFIAKRGFKKSYVDKR